MKTLTIFILATLPVLASPIAGGACADGTFQEFIDLGGAGCTLSQSGIHLSGAALTSSVPAFVASDLLLFVNDSIDHPSLQWSTTANTEWLVSGNNTATLAILLNWDAGTSWYRRDAFRTFAAQEACAVSVTFNGSETVNPHCPGPETSFSTVEALTSESGSIQATLTSSGPGAVGFGDAEMLFSPHPIAATIEPATLVLTGSAFIFLFIARKRSRTQTHRFYAQRGVDFAHALPIRCTTADLRGVPLS